MPTQPSVSNFSDNIVVDEEEEEDLPLMWKIMSARFDGWDGRFHVTINKEVNEGRLV